MSETARYREFTEPYCWIPNPDKTRFKSPRKDGKIPGCGIDLASGGDPVVPWAWQLELPHDAYMHYNANQPVRGPIQLRADAITHRAAEPDSLDFVYASHLLEDVPETQWTAIMAMWSSMLKPGGHLILLVPERDLWAAALARGQSPNCSHRFKEGAGEPSVGDMSKHAVESGLEVVEERLTALDAQDYTILGVFKRTS